MWRHDCHHELTLRQSGGLLHVYYRGKAALLQKPVRKEAVCTNVSVEYTSSDTVSPN